MNNTFYAWKKTVSFLLATAISTGAVSSGAIFNSSLIIIANAAEGEEKSSDTVNLEETEKQDDNPDYSETSDESEFDIATFFSNKDVIRVTERALSYYAEDFYRSKTGITPANIDIKMPSNDETVIITLTDENDIVLDVYYINCWQYTGEDQNGEYANLIANDDESYRNEDEYFVPLYNVYDAVKLHYLENYNTVPIEYSFFNNTENRLFNGNGFEDFYFIDDKGQTIIKYVIDPTTGIGTDSYGNDVDLNPYIHQECKNICSYVRKDYQAKNGEQLLVTYFDLNGEEGSARIEVMTTDDRMLDVYTVDLDTLIAETEDGETVDLKVYDEDNYYFAPLNQMGVMAENDYKAKNGKTPAKSELIDNLDGTFSVILSDENGEVLDTYVFNPETGMGTDSKGGEVNLPQTGISSVKAIAPIAVATAFMIIGASAYISSIGRRKKDE